jgi:hypothetical protein
VLPVGCVCVGRFYPSTRCGHMPRAWHLQQPHLKIQFPEKSYQLTLDILPAASQKNLEAISLRLTSPEAPTQSGISRNYRVGMGDRGWKGLAAAALNRSVEQRRSHQSTIHLNCSDGKRSCGCPTPLHGLSIPQTSWGYLSALIKNFMGLP